ncbi:unnamed protein product, partial [Rotaria sp. Silwood2]
MENTSGISEKTPSSTPSIDEKDLVTSMRKLDLIKELGEKQNQFQRLQNHLQQNTELFTRENQVLREFRKELDMLVQERMSHIEELRLIHADINIMETTIKQAEEERTRALQDSKRLLKDYQPIKEQINKLRDMLNLERLPDHDEDETTLVAIQLISQQSGDHDLTSNRSSHLSSTGLDNTHEQIPLGVPYQHHQSQQMANTTSTNISMPNNNQQQASTLNIPKVIGNIGSNLDRATFRQQPPPMKILIMARRYDTRATIFSPEGRLYQVEYALEAISHAGASLGILAENGVVLAGEKRNISPLLDDVKYSEKIYKVHDDLCCSVSGITSDANVLINELRLIGQRYLLTYQEPAPIEYIVSRLCNIKQAYTQFGGKRPFGVSFLYMGWDKHYGYQLYQSDPSGNYGGWKATCVGHNSQTAISILKQEYKIGETQLNDALRLAIRVFSKTLDTTKLTPEKI